MAVQVYTFHHYQTQRLVPQLCTVREAELGVRNRVLPWTTSMGWVCVAVGLGLLVITRTYIPHIVS